MKRRLRFRVLQRSMYADPGGALSAGVVLKPCGPIDKDDPNEIAWGGRRPQGELILSFLDPRTVEQWEPGMELEVIIRTKDNNHENASRDPEPGHQPSRDPCQARG